MFAYHSVLGFRAARIIFLFFLFTAGSVSAAWDGYLGASASVSQWQMGFASGKKMQLFNLRLDTNKPDPVLYMGGLSASVLYNKTWGITYQGEIGTAQPLIQLTGPYDDSYAPNPARQSRLSAETKVFRTDHSLALTRVLGASGFSVYAGVKVQAFGYHQDTGRYIEVEMGTGAVVAEHPFSIRQNILNYGPAAGLTYSFRIYRKIFAALQAGFIYFPGKYTLDMTFSLIPGQNMTNRADETFYGLGATGLASLIVPISDAILLQVAGRGQYYYARTREGTSTTQTTTQIKTTPSSTMDNVQDLLIGGHVAVICKIF